MNKSFWTCSKCDSVMNPNGTGWCDWTESSVQFYTCPNCGNEDYEHID